MPAEILKVGFQFVDFPEEHPPRDSPFDRARFVKTEIDAAEIAQQEEDLIQGCVRRYSLFGLRPFIRAKDLYVGQCVSIRGRSLPAAGRSPRCLRRLRCGAWHCI